ncbi:MAG: hypothetical protein Fur0042_09950 [Cyanophyceae cyanobacterium]
MSTEIQPLAGRATVLMRIGGNVLEIALDGDNAPITAGNFAELADSGFYDGIPFHRVVREPSPFVIQAGDPAGKDPNVPLNRLGAGGFVDPVTGTERRIPLEIKPQGAATPTYSQAVSGVPLALTHQRGTIAMARAQALDSASSQFYIALAPQPFLDGQYAPFGQVVGGLEAIDGVQQGDRIEFAKVVDGTLATRRSAIVGDTALLNAATNFLNRADLPVVGGFAFLGAGGEAKQVAAGELAATPNGLRALAGDDTIAGSDGADIIWGDEGNDSISGGAGNDYLRGNEGNDTLNGGAGSDFLNGNQGNDLVSGGAGNDFVRGGQGNDQLLGDAGDDVLCGDFGSDTLTGGLGADVFAIRVATVVGSTAETADVITDFSRTEGDRIAIVGNLTLADLTAEASGSDVLVRAASSVLARVQNAAVADVQAGLFVTGTNDAALRL